MLLSRLYEYSERIADLAPPMYTKTPIRWYVDLDAMGRFQGVAGVLGEGKRADRGRLLDVPALPVKRTMAVIPILLADNAQYVLGLVPEGKDPDRIGQYHAAFKELVHRCADATEEPGVHAVARFLDG